MIPRTAATSAAMAALFREMADRHTRTLVHLNVNAQHRAELRVEEAKCRMIMETVSGVEVPAWTPPPGELVG